MKAGWLMVGLLLVGSTNAFAWIQDGNTLVRGWAAFKQNGAGTMTRDNDFVSGNYLGYVAGVSDSLGATGELCSPPTTTANQIAAMVGKYLDEHPGEWTDGGPMIVLHALAQFRCHKPA